MNTNSELFTFLQFISDSSASGEFSPPAVDDFTLTATGIAIVVLVVTLYIQWLKR